MFRSETLRPEGEISSFMNSNNPLAAEPETENDAGVEKSSVTRFLDSPRLQRRLARQR
jgi:hypothetical protein